mgnify:FL=1
MIVTIDGPAGAGKSSVARALAERLAFEFLDTGAMYRAVALAALEAGHNWDDASGLAALARSLTIELAGDRVLLNGRDVSQEIRTPRVTANIYHAADNAAVRTHLVELQRRAAAGKNIVSEGRDQGSVVFPDARCKIFLTATPEERARRRVADLESRGQTATFAEVFAEQNRRDLRDSSRDVGPLVEPDDAVVVWTDGLTPEEVVERLESLARARMASA